MDAQHLFIDGGYPGGKGLIGKRLLGQFRGAASHLDTKRGIFHEFFLVHSSSVLLSCPFVSC